VAAGTPTSWVPANFLFAFSCATKFPIWCAEYEFNQPLPPSIASAAKIFVTKTAWIPAGGFATADAVCQNEATDAGLSGTYFAFLNSNTALGTVRFNRLDNYVYARTDGELFGSLKTPLSFLHRHADGSAASNDSAWSGSATLLEPTQTCQNWTSSASSDIGGVGVPIAAGLETFSNVGIPCNNARPLYCVEQ
jgi:hypothetical protein